MHGGGRLEDALPEAPGRIPAVPLRRGPLLDSEGTGARRGAGKQAAARERLELRVQLVERPGVDGNVMEADDEPYAAALQDDSARPPWAVEGEVVPPDRQPLSRCIRRRVRVAVRLDHVQPDWGGIPDRLGQVLFAALLVSGPQPFMAPFQCFERAFD